MRGSKLIIGFAICLALFAAGLFYTINYSYYDRSEMNEFALSTDNGELILKNVDMINSDRTPLKIRICADPIDTTGLEAVDTATPLVAPFWFKCFNAGKLSEEIAAGTLSTFRIESNKPFGFDLYLAQNDARSYFWRQLNECGEAQFSGDPLPATCPEFKE